MVFNINQKHIAMIKSIHLKLLRNAEYLQFLKLFLQLVEAHDPTALLVLNQYKNLLTEYQDLEVLFKQPLAHELSKEVADLDVLRDRAIVGIASVVRGYVNHFDPTMAAAATLLYNNLQLYGEGISTMNYQAETATITSLVKDWKNDAKLSAAESLLGLLKWREELDNVNKEFEQKYSTRTADYGNDTSPDILSKRKVTNTVYYKLVEHLEAHSVINDSPNYTKLNNQLNALIDQYNTLLATRKPEKKE